MKVSELMSNPVLTVRRDTSVTDIARLMVQRDFSALPVTDDSGGVVGIVTEGDVVTKHARVHAPAYFGILGGVLPFTTHRMDEEVRKILAVAAGDLMSHRVSTIGPEEDVDEAASRLAEHESNPLLVIENDRLIGILSRADIVRLLVLEEQNDEPDVGTA